jgi:hypothetical protein
MSILFLVFFTSDFSPWFAIVSFCDFDFSSTIFMVEPAPKKEVAGAEVGFEATVDERDDSDASET